MFTNIIGAEELLLTFHNDQGSSLLTQDRVALSPQVSSEINIKSEY